MKTKYISMSDGDEELIFTFPACINHGTMLNTISHMSNIGGRAQMFYGFQVVGAGFVAENICYGRSDSIGIKSRGDADTALLAGAAV